MIMAQDSQVAYLLKLAEKLNSQRQTSNMTDVILVCEEKEFPAHKLILSATSDYFRSVFESGCEESKRTRLHEPLVCSRDMELILSFLYTGKFVDTDDSLLLEDLLETSRLLQISALFECCYKRISERLNCNHFLDIWNLAFKYNDEGMTKHVLTFLAEHFEDVTLSEEFLKLNACQMLEICQHRDTLQSSMDVIIKGLFRWAEVEEEREMTVLQILTKLDLKRMSTAFLSENLRDRLLIKKNCHILKLLTAEASTRMLTLSSIDFENGNDPKLMTFGETCTRQVFRMYNIKQNQWSRPKILPFNLEVGMSTVWFGGHVYFLGGGDMITIEPSAKIIKYCPETNTSASCGSLAVPIRQAGTGVLNEYIYVVNGYHKNWESHSTVQRYNPTTETCDLMAQTNNRHLRPHVFPFGKYLLVLGFFFGDNSVERYDPECDTWTLITSISGAATLFSAAICKEKLYVVPKNTTSEIQIYDFPFAMWEHTEFDHSSRKILELHSTMVEGKYILLIRDGNNVVHSFDPKLNHWLRKSLPNPGPWDPWLTCVA